MYFVLLYVIMYFISKRKNLQKKASNFRVHVINFDDHFQKWQANLTKKKNDTLIKFDDCTI